MVGKVVGLANLFYKFSVASDLSLWIKIEYGNLSVSCIFYGAVMLVIPASSKPVYLHNLSLKCLKSTIEQSQLVDEMVHFIYFDYDLTRITDRNDSYFGYPHSNLRQLLWASSHLLHLSVNLVTSGKYPRFHSRYPTSGPKFTLICHQEGRVTIQFMAHSVSSGSFLWNKIKSYDINNNCQ